MKTKYFRFLYFGKKDCLLHVGEIEDTRTGERLTFLYIDGSGQSVDLPEREAVLSGQAADEAAGKYDRKKNGKTGHEGYPEKADILVVGDSSEKTERVLEEILAEVTVGTVIYPQDDILRSVLGRYKIGKGIELSAGTDNADFQMKQAGWELYAASLERGCVVLLHGLKQWEMFDDCVMNVSVLDGVEHQGWWKEKDGFAAAMRCTVCHDYDACRYLQCNGGRGYRVSSLLYGKTYLRKCLEWMKSLNDDGRLGKGLRFLSLPTAGMEAVWDEKVLDWIPEGHKCYYISKPGEPVSQAITQICKRSPYQIPAVTGEGTGICCAGFLKYAE